MTLNNTKFHSDLASNSSFILKCNELGSHYDTVNVSRWEGYNFIVREFMESAEDLYFSYRYVILRRGLNLSSNNPSNVTLETSDSFFFQNLDVSSDDANSSILRAYSIIESNAFVTNSRTIWSFIFRFDFFFIAFEFFAILTLLAYFFTKNTFRDQRVTTLYLNSTYGGLSYYEVIGFATSCLSLIVFDIVTASVDEDILDMASLLVFLFVAGALAGFLVGFNFIKSYAALTPVSNGETTKRVYFSDIINFLLCALRVFLCWTRYIFYDLQVEHVDMALQFTDEVGNIINLSVTGPYFIFFTILFFVLDVIFLSIQIAICLFKFAIASFLLWLILDLFLLRVNARSSEMWLINLIGSRK